MPKLTIGLGIAALMVATGLVLPGNVRQARTAAQESPAVPRRVPVPDSDLIGKYYYGDGLGHNCHLDLLPNQRFDYRLTGCLGEYDRNNGTWEVRGDILILQCEQKSAMAGPDVRLVPMIWSKHLFLVDEFQAPGFCSTLKVGKDVNRGGPDEVHGLHYVKLIADGYKAAQLELPDFVAERFRLFVGKPPIECKVVKLLEDGNVEIDKGSAAGLRPGLRLTAALWTSQELEIVSVSAQSAIAVPGYFGNSVGEVTVGSAFHTGGEYNQPRGTGTARLTSPRKRP